MAIITISRQLGAMGDKIAETASKKLNYSFIDRAEIERRIISKGFDKEILKKYDEKKPGFFASLAKERDEYLHYLQIVVLEAAAEDNTVLIGRGAFAILADLPNALTIRVVAPNSVRQSRLMQERNINEKQAKQVMTESDKNLLGFHKGFFNIDSTDSTLFHMILNTGLLDVEESTNVIVELVKHSITPEKESAGHAKLDDFICGQKLVNSLIFEYKLNINFLHAVNENKVITLQGVADSSSVVEKALAVSRKILPNYQIKSAINIVQDFN